MKLFFTIVLASAGFSQDVNSKISTIEFVEIVNNNREESIFYFENNWKVLREMALKKTTLTPIYC